MSMSSSFTSNSSNSDNGSSNSNSISSSNNSSKSLSSSSISLSSSLTSVSAQPTFNATVVSQTSVRPFGYPEYNYSRIENKSKNDSNLSHPSDYKNRYLIRQQISKDNFLSSSKWKNTPKRTYLSENDEDLIVSEVDDNFRKNVKLHLKEKNVHLINEHNLTQVLPIQEILKNKKMLDILWKLYRFPGESLKDIKKRLFYSLLDNTVESEIKSELVSNESKYSEHELCYDNRMKDSNKNIKLLDIDSDSNSENFSYLNKLKFINYEYFDLKNKNVDGEKSEEFIESIQDSIREEEQDLNYNYRLKNENSINHKNDSIKYRNIYKEERGKDDFNTFSYSYESPCLLADFLDIEINVNEKENVFIQPDNFVENESVTESINWTFNKLSKSLPNKSYSEPLVKQIPNKQRLSDGKKIKRRTTKVQKRTKIKSMIEAKKKPIICEMYGTRTINYDYPLESQIPKWQSCSNLTDTSEDCELQNHGEIEQKSFNPDKKTAIGNTKAASEMKIKEGNVLELKNNFSVGSIRKRANSSSSCRELNLPNFSDEDDFDEASLSALEKKSSFALEEKTNYLGIEDNVAVASIKRADKAISSLLELEEKRRLEESKITVSMTSTEPVVDPDTVKVKKSSTDVKEGSQNVSVSVNSKENDEDDRSLDSDSDSNSDSSSSSCMCSRSSCLGVTSSSSTDSSIENDHNSNMMKSKNEGL